DEEPASSAPSHSAAFAASIVRRLLEAANKDWRLWASLSPLLPRLAEGAPDEFLTALESALKQDSPPILRLFDEGNDTMFARSSHTGLLWALETLAWSPAHVARAAIALATLSRLAPAGKTLNQPGASLR